MATLSLRQIAQNCLGATGDISVNSHVYGYIFRDADGSVFGTLGGGDTFPGSGGARTRSLKRHLQTISGQSTDLVVILVGHENDFSGAVTRDQVAKAQYAIQVARDLYAEVSLGIRTINWQRIPLADAGGYVDIAGRDEAQDLTDDWSGPGGGIDVFLPRQPADLDEGAARKTKQSDVGHWVLQCRCRLEDLRSLRHRQKPSARERAKSSAWA